MEGVDCRSEDFAEHIVEAQHNIEEDSENESSHPYTDSDSKVDI